MQLDRTNVVIRARSLSEIGDLAMILIRRYPAASILGFAIGLVPWAILNLVLVGWIPITQFAAGIYDDEMDAELNRYLFLMTTLVILQTPIAGVMTTSLIGRAVFEQRVTWRSACADLRQIFWRWFWVLGVIRGPLPLMLILASNWGQELAVGREILIPLVFLFLVGIQRGSRPFMPEILLLERCPLRTQSATVIQVGRRNAALHGPMAGELIGRFLAVSMMLGVFFLAAFLSLLWVRGVMLGQWEWTLLVYLVFVPAALWTVAGLSVLIRFLSYLDTRIRLEGWEVELAIRAEAQRQFGDPVNTAPAAREMSAKRPVLTIVSALLGLSLLQIPEAPAKGSWLVTGLVAAAEHPADRSDGEVTVPSNPSSIWYDAESQELRPVPVQTRLPDASNRDSRWLPPAEKVKAPGPVGSGMGGGSTARHAIGWIVLAVLALVLIGMMLYIFSKAEPAALGAPKWAMLPGRERLDQQTLQRMLDLPAEVRRTDVNLYDEAQRLMNLGRLDEAIVLLFGHQLLLLDRCGFLRLARGKTNGRYLRETRAHSPEAHWLLTATVAAFEASYFGHHAPEAEQFKKLWADNAALESIVHANLGVAV